MSIGSDIFYFAVLGAMFMLSMLGLWFIAILPGIERWSKRFFLAYFTVLMLCCFAVFLEFILYTGLFPAAATYFALVQESLFLSLPMVMVTIYLLHCGKENLRASRLLHAVLVLWAVYVALLVSARFTGVLLYNSSDNGYYRGPLYSILVLPLIAILLLNLAGAIRWRKRFSRKTFYSFLVATLPMVAGMFVQMFIDVFPVLDIGMVLGGLSMYGLVLSDQIEADLHRQREIANQRTSIMVLQMRPHFIYNTMTSIYCLCDQDPKLARQVILDFTAYLRRNFTAIASEAPIPFSSELEHTRAYLAVEKAQYEEGLFVDYDTPHTRFRIPPLTLQPIVENAIKHGRDPYAGVFRISVRTRKTDGGSEIVVADNGRGFAADETNEAGIALKNIRQRLEIMCGGSLAITDASGGGTVVTVTIPDNGAQDDLVADK